MKHSWSLFLGVAVATSTQALDPNRYMGYNATIHDGDVALCGYRLFGCIGVKQPCRHSQTLLLGSFEDIGTPFHTWQYHQGMLYSNAPISSRRNMMHDESDHHHMMGGDDHDASSMMMVGEDSDHSPTSSSTQRMCVGIRHDASATLVDLPTTTQQSYAVELQDCDHATAVQQWLFSQGRVVSFALPEYCLTIASETYAANQAHGSSIVLQKCRDDRTDAQQRIDIKSMQPLEEFVLVNQTKYGHDDKIRLGYQCADSDAMLQIYQVMPLQKEWSSSSEDYPVEPSSDVVNDLSSLRLVANQTLNETTSNVWSIRASDLISTATWNDASLLVFIAQFANKNSSRVVFSIDLNQAHTMTTASPTALPLGAIIGTIAVAVLVGVAWIVYCYYFYGNYDYLNGYCDWQRRNKQKGTSIPSTGDITSKQQSAVEHDAETIASSHHEHDEP